MTESLTQKRNRCNFHPRVGWKLQRFCMFGGMVSNCIFTVWVLFARKIYFLCQRGRKRYISAPLDIFISIPKSFFCLQRRTSPHTIFLCLCSVKHDFICTQHLFTLYCGCIFDGKGLLGILCNLLSRNCRKRFTNAHTMLSFSAGQEP